MTPQGLVKNAGLTRSAVVERAPLSITKPGRK